MPLVVVTSVLEPLVEVTAKLFPLPTSDPEAGNELDDNEDKVGLGKLEVPELVVGQPLGTVPDSVDTDPDTHGYTLGTELDGSRWVPLKGMGALLDEDTDETAEGAATVVATGGSAPLLPSTLPPTAWMDCQVPL
jgi:hypothetical protein